MPTTYDYDTAKMALEAQVFLREVQFIHQMQPDRVIPIDAFEPATFAVGSLGMDSPALAMLMLLALWQRRVVHVAYRHLGGHFILVPYFCWRGSGPKPSARGGRS